MSCFPGKLPEMSCFLEQSSDEEQDSSVPDSLCDHDGESICCDECKKQTLESILGISVFAALNMKTHPFSHVVFLDGVISSANSNLSESVLSCILATELGQRLQTRCIVFVTQLDNKKKDIHFFRLQLSTPFPLRQEQKKMLLFQPIREIFGFDEMLIWFFRFNNEGRVDPLKQERRETSLKFSDKNLSQMLLMKFKKDNGVTQMILKELALHCSVALRREFQSNILLHLSL